MVDTENLIIRWNKLRDLLNSDDLKEIYSLNQIEKFQNEFDILSEYYVR